jgi:glycosyltransferase involved in cell wall biosynthesis
MTGKEHFKGRRTMTWPARLGIGWQIGVPSGWGVYGVNLALELARRDVSPEIFFIQPGIALTADQAAVLTPHLQRQPANLARFRAGSFTLDAPVLHALGDKLDLPEQLGGLRGTPDIGVVFFESTRIPPANLEAARRYRVIIAGSAWNAEVLRRHGLQAVRNCPQGVDLSLFRPGPKPATFANRFVVFSGGKLEYRKGQDLVLAAFKRFHARHADALLVAAWHNPWPQAARTLAMSTHTTNAPGLDARGKLDVSGWAQANGIPADAFHDLGALQNAQTAEVLRAADVALLPSRCEGGTNLVAMECMACGVPVILSRNTGHHDLICEDNCYPLDMQLPIGALTGRKDLEDWGESSVDEIVAKLEQAYSGGADRARRGAAAADFMQDWGWPAQVGRLLGVVSEFA